MSTISTDGRRCSKRLAMVSQQAPDPPTKILKISSIESSSSCSTSSTIKKTKILSSTKGPTIPSFGVTGTVTKATPSTIIKASIPHIKTSNVHKAAALKQKKQLAKDSTKPDSSSTMLKTASIESSSSCSTSSTIKKTKILSSSKALTVNGFGKTGTMTKAPQTKISNVQKALQQKKPLPNYSPKPKEKPMVAQPAQATTKQFNSRETHILSSSSTDNSSATKSLSGTQAKVPESFTTEGWRIKHFSISKFIGRGQFGNVFLAKPKTSDHIMVLKVVPKRKLDRSMFARFADEFQIGKDLALCPCVVRIYLWGEEPSLFFLGMEYMQLGELFNLMYREKDHTEKTAATILYQIADAVSYCHEEKVWHRDIKPENILVDYVYRDPKDTSNRIYKLADFGWAAREVRGRRRTVCGTTEYMAPEIIGRDTYDDGVDTWALGILLYELLVGRSPFACDSEDKTQSRIVAYHARPPNERPRVDFPPSVSREARDFIMDVLTPDPQQRYTAHQLRDAPYILKNHDKDNYGVKQMRLFRQKLADGSLALPYSKGS